MQNTDLLIHNLCHQGYHFLDHWLPLPLFLALQQSAMNMYQEGLFKSAKIGKTIHATRNETIRSDQILWLEDNESAPEIQTVLTKVKALSQLLNQELFLGLHEFEAHFANYQPGTFYKKHIDQFILQKTRQISFVYYLNSNWQEADGGALKIYAKDGDECLEQILPLGNRLVCFRSDLPHEVCLTLKPRYSLTGWMKTRSE